MPDTLNTLCRLRKFSVDEARQKLAACLRDETEATAAEKAADAAIRRERDAAAALEADDGAVEAFAAWLPQGRRAQDLARQARNRAEANTAVARARLAAAIAAAAVVDRLRDTRLAEQHAESGRREQARLDEIAQGCRRAEHGG